MEKLPILRFGEVYESSQKCEIYDNQNKVMSQISVAIPLIYKTDITRRSKAVSKKLRDTDINQIFQWIKRAGEIFMSEDVDIGGTVQSPQKYCDNIMRVTGLPLSTCKDILKDVRNHMGHIDEIVQNQFRIDDLQVLNTFKTTFKAMMYSIAPKADILCVVMPGNHPIVNIMWIIAFAMKYPILIKPSFDDPYTPLRLIYSLISAGADKEFFSFYPVGHSEVTELLKTSGCGIIFGGKDIKELYSNYPWIRVHGPGNSKIIVGKDCMADIEEIARFAAKSAMFHSGRACINTSAIIVENDAEALAAAIGRVFSKVEAKDLEDAEATLGAEKDKHKAEMIAAAVKQIINSGKFVDMTPDVEIIRYYNNRVYLMPKVLYCKDVNDPSFGIEYPFPFVMVGEVGESKIGDLLAGTLSCCVLSENNNLIKEVLVSSGIEKIYQGFTDSCRMDFGMPHNGFISDFLYKYKAFKC